MPAATHCAEYGSVEFRGDIAGLGRDERFAIAAWTSR